MARALTLWHPLVEGTRVRFDLTAADGGALAVDELPAPEALLSALGAPATVRGATVERFRSPYFAEQPCEAVHVQLRVEPVPAVTPRFEPIALDAEAAPPGTYAPSEDAPLVLIGWADAATSATVLSSVRQLPPVRRAEALPFAPSLKQLRAVLRHDAAEHAIEATREALAGIVRATTASEAQAQTALLRRVPPRPDRAGR